jgi:hypothetical protein
MTFWEFFFEHPLLVIVPVGFLIWGVAELIVALTPTEKDDSALKIIRKFLWAFINLVPRLKKGGGKFN